MAALATTSYNKPFCGTEDYDFLRHTLQAITDGTFEGKLMTLVPQHPKAGRIFAYRRKSDGDNLFLLDGYHRFNLIGRKTIPSHGLIREYRHLYLPCADGSRKGRIKVNFHKHVFYMSDPGAAKNSGVIVHYFGDEHVYIPNAHGNSKTGKVYTRSSHLTLDVIKRLAKDGLTKPKTCYKKLVNQIQQDKVLRKREASFAPRNVTQIINMKANVKRQLKLAACPISALFEIAKTEMGKFILKLDLVPHFLVIFSDPEILQLTNRILKHNSTHPHEPQLLCYDTTFNLTDGYVSALVCRNTFLYGDPIFPVCFMIHDRKVGSTHAALWETVSKHIDLSVLCKTVPVCVDREAALTNAIKAVIPEANIIYCVNHIRTDVKEWIRRNGGTSDDIQSIGKHLTVLVHSETEIDFNMHYDLFEELWSEGLVEYMKQFVKEDLKPSCRFSANRFAAFFDTLPTNNLSESLNCVAKYASDWKEYPIDTLTLKLLGIQWEHCVEAARSCNSLGNYRVKAECKGLAEVHPREYMYMSEHDLGVALKKEVVAQVEPLPLVDQRTTSKELLATKSVQMDYVHFSSKQRLWTVRSIFNPANTYCVQKAHDGKRGLHWVCTCNTSDCYHIWAVRLALDEPFSPLRKGMQLAVLNRKGRGHKRKLGRKRPNVDDISDLIRAAADSKLAKAEYLLADSTGNYPFGKHSTSEAPLLNSSPQPSPSPTQFFPSQQQSLPSTAKSLPLVAHKLPASPLQQLPSSPFEQSSATLFHCTPYVNASSASVSTQNAIISDATNSINTILHGTSSVPLCKKDVAKLNVNANALLNNNLLDGELLDLVIQQLLRRSGCDRITYIPEICSTTVSCGSYETCFRHMVEQEALNQDVLLVVLNKDAHWVLGVILLTPKCILLLDSMYHCHRHSATYAVSLFDILNKICALAYYAVDLPFNGSEWKFVYANDVPQQKNGTECGVFVCLNVLALVSNSAYADDACTSNSHRNRRWMYETLAEYHQGDVIKCAYRRIHKELFKKNCAALSSSTATKIEVCHGASLSTITSEIFKPLKDWTICAKTDCTGNADHEEQQLMCVLCRCWIHRLCSELQDLSACKYFLCNNCEKAGKNKIE